MRTTTAALALALAACGGGGGTGTTTQQTTPPATQTPSPTPTLDHAVQAVRDAVAHGLEACPCEVEVRVRADDESVTMTGYFDPESGNSALRDASAPVLQTVVSDGRMFLTTPEIKKQGRGYVQLDFSNVPPDDKQSFFTLLAPANPYLATLLAQSVSEITEETKAGARVTFDVEFDVQAATAAAGYVGGTLARLVTDATSIGQVVLVGDELSEVRFSALGTGGSTNETVDVHLVVKKRRVAERTIEEPKWSGTLDVAAL